jgi:hypothetical protein
MNSLRKLIKNSLKCDAYSGEDLYYDLKNIKNQYPTWRKNEAEKLSSIHSLYTQNSSKSNAKKYIKVLDEFITNEKNLSKQMIATAGKMKNYLNQYA